MKPRKLYWSRKNKQIIAEGKRNNKTIYLFKLPSVQIVAESSLFPKEKRNKILEKISRLDIKENPIVKEK